MRSHEARTYRRLWSQLLLLAGVIFTSASTLLASTSPSDLSSEPEDPRRVTIVVLNAASREPIIGAVVRCTGAISPDVTDQSGRCVLRFKQPVREVQVQITYIGYKTIRSTSTITPGKPLTFRMQEDVKQFREVLISGQRRQTNKLQQTARISSEVLDKGGATSLAKMLETIPGVSSISSGSTVAKPVIQGMHSSRILLMNNGVRLESQSWGADHAPEIDYTGASMVEVVKGAECVRYGFGAMGGVVLLNEAPLPYGNDKLQVHGKANLGYDTNARGGSGSGSLELGYRNVGLRLHGMYTKGGDYRTAEYILNNTGYNTISVVVSTMPARSPTSISSSSDLSTVGQTQAPSIPSPTASSPPSSNHSISPSRESSNGTSTTTTSSPSRLPSRRTSDRSLRTARR